MDKTWRFRGHVLLLDPEPRTGLEALRQCYVCENCQLRVTITEYASLPTMQKLMNQGASRGAREMASEQWNRIQHCHHPT